MKMTDLSIPSIITLGKHIPHTTVSVAFFRVKTIKLVDVQ